MAVARSALDAYFQKYRVNDLLKDLTEDLALHRPEDPQRHLLDRLIGLNENSADRIQAVTPRPPEGVSFLRVNVECKTKTGSCIRLFTKNGAQDSTPARTVLSWKMAAVAEMSAVVNEALGLGSEAPEEADAPAPSENKAEEEAKTRRSESTPSENKAEGEVAVLREEIKKLQSLIHELEVKLHDTQVLNELASVTSHPKSNRRRSHPHAVVPDFKRRPSASDADSRMPPDVMETPGRTESASVHKMGYKKDTSVTCDNRPPIEGCCLRIIQVNDVYDLAHWPAFDSVVRHHSFPTNTITVLPGDFLAPSLLSSLDNGKGMVDIMNKVGERGIEVVCFGNHEADVPYQELLNRIDEFQGCWLNSNMAGFKCRKELPEYKIVEVEGGGQKRKVGLIGLVTVDPNLYQAGAFGGAIPSATPVPDAAARLRNLLLHHHACDLVIPLTHQALADDRAMAKEELGFPLIVGAHDHEPCLEQVSGAWITKAGMDAQNAVIIDIRWPGPETAGGEAEIRAELVRCDDYVRSAPLEAACAAHMRQVEAMERAYLCEIPAELRPLSSEGVRQGQRTVGTLIASLVRRGLCAAKGRCEAVMLDAGAIRRGFCYPADQQNFSFGDLKKEVPFGSEVAVVGLPGAVLAAAVKASRSKASLQPPQDHAGYMQVCDSVEWDEAAQEVVRVGGAALEGERVYRVGVLAVSLNGMNRNQPLIDWANSPGQALPNEEECYGAKELVVRECSGALLAQVSDLARFDADGSGYLDAAEIKLALQHIVGGQEVPEAMVENLMRIVDENNDGRIDAAELQQFVAFFKQMHAFKVHDGAGCNLRIIQVNDVYELHNWPAFDGLVRHHTLRNTITVLPGDFLAPSLLSSLDNGKGMVDIMNKVGERGIEVVCFGNHEADVPYQELLNRIDEFKGCWLNSNMAGFKCRKELPEYKIVEVEGGGQKRKVGLIGLVTVDPNLYQAGAFGGAIPSATPVPDAAARLRNLLLHHHACDLVIPLTHQVMAEDRAMANLNLGFPLIVGAHDHEPYLEQVNGAWITKAGMDAEQAVIIDVTWPTPDTPGDQPHISVELVPTNQYPRSAPIAAAVTHHLRPVEEMEGAFLCAVEHPPGQRRLSSKGIRRAQTSVGSMLTSLVRDGLRLSGAGEAGACDGVMLDAGAIRRGFDYPDSYPHFTYDDLKKEVPFSSEVVVVSLPGALLSAAVAFSRQRAYYDPPEDWGGFLQLDDGFEWDAAARAVTKINGAPLEGERVYRVGVLQLSLNGMNRNQPLIDWADANPTLIPDEDMGRQAKELIVACCATRVWAQLPSFHLLDADQDGVISVEEVQQAMQKAVGSAKQVSRVDAEKLVAAIDQDSDGTITREELEHATSFKLQNPHPPTST